MLRMPTMPLPESVPATFVVPPKVAPVAMLRKPPLLIVAPPVMVPPEIEFPAPFTVTRPVVKVPALLRVLLPAYEIAPMLPMPLKVAPLAIESLPLAVPLTINAELAF